MNKTQKGACYGLLLAVLFLAVPIIDKYESQLGLVWTHVIGYCVCIPALIVPLFFLMKKSGRHEVEYDERDKAIIKKAVIVGFVTLGAAELIGYVAILTQKEHGRPMLTTDNLSIALYYGFIIYIFSLSTTVLIQYGKGEQSNE